MKCCRKIIMGGFVSLSFCGWAQNASGVDYIKILEEMEAVAKTNLPLAVQENNFSRIAAIGEGYKKMGVVVNTPEHSNLPWQEAEPRYLRLQLQTLQALFEMRVKWTQINPLYIANLSAENQYNENNTDPKTIDDLELRRQYVEWLAYRDANWDEVRQNGRLENAYRQMKAGILPWQREEKHIPVFESAITNKMLLKELFPPDGVPRFIPVQKRKKDDL